MDADEKNIALESIITEYAIKQMNLNDVSPIDAYFIMKGVFGRFQEICMNSIIMSRVHAPGPENAETTSEPDNEDGGNV